MVDSLLLVGVDTLQKVTKLNKTKGAEWLPHFGGFMIELPVRRYAIFENISYQKYAIVIKGEQDIKTAPIWGGFVCWLGGVKEATTRGDKREAK